MEVAQSNHNVLLVPLLWDHSDEVIWKDILGCININVCKYAPQYGAGSGILYFL